tara:strand:- start:481 stop:1293 length:813 start_codon:yes stop_codon:yes gene_type:complete
MIFKYISGNKLTHAFTSGKNIINSNKIPIINFAVENNIGKKLINNEFKNISNLINSNYRIALKLSLFDFNIDLIKNTIDLFVNKNIKVLIDAENENNFNIYNDSCNELIKIYNKNKVNVLKTYQMYRKDSMDILDYDCNYAKNNNLYQGIKLVRGAYYNEDKNKNVLFKNKYETDLNYNKSLLYLYNNPINKSIIIASHNQESINLGYLLNQENKIFEFAHLLGMNEKNYNKLIKNNETVNVYIPYGPYKYMLPYLTRRLYENIDTIKYM